MSATTVLSLSLALCFSSDTGGAAGGGKLIAKPVDPLVRLDEVGLSVRGECEIVGDFGLQLRDVRVLGVRPGSAAARAGLRPGDRIFGVDRHSVDDWKAAFKDSAWDNLGERHLGRLLAPKGWAVLDVERPDQGTLQIPIRLP